jgi:outer membrane protein assembly factor BamB
LGAITAGLALDNGIIYVGTETGGLHLINIDGTLLCETRLDGSIQVNPVVVDALAYIAVGSVMRVMPAGVCEPLVSETVQYLSETVIDVAPAVVGDLMYIPNGIFLNAVDRVAVQEGVSDPLDVHHWSPGKVQADGKIASPPVVTNDAVYFGTETGWVHAVDSDSGELLWEWHTESYVRASPVVIEGAVYIAGGDSKVYAVGPSG